jgi:hypothetical protein
MKPVTVNGTGDRDAQNRAAQTAWRAFLAEHSPRGRSARDIIASQGGVPGTLRALGIQRQPGQKHGGKEFHAAERALQRAAKGQQVPGPKYMALLKPLGDQQQQARVDAAMGASAKARDLLGGRRVQMHVEGTIRVSADKRRRTTVVDLDTGDAEDMAGFRDDPLGWWEEDFSADVEGLDGVWFS